MVYLVCWKGVCLGVIDAIADGCFAVARRPITLAPVVALDCFYWVSGRLTPAPLVNLLIRGVTDGGQQQGLSGGEIDSFVAPWRSLAADGDLLYLIAVGQKPLLPLLDPDQVGRPWGFGVLDPGNWALVVLAMLGLVVVGLFWLALTLAVLSPLARDEAFDWRIVLGRSGRYWLRLLGLCGVVLGGLLLLGLPLLLLSVLLAALGLNPAAPALLILLPILPLYLFLGLAPEAIVVSDAGPLRAIKLSVAVVRRNFWGMIGLLVATFVITQGFAVALALVARQSAGVPLAIVANGLLGTGLTAAGLLYYRERLEALTSPRPAVGGQQQGQRHQGGQR